MAIQRRQFLGLAAVVAGGPCWPAAMATARRSASIPAFPIGPFGAESTAEEVTAGLDLNGRTALVTGCNSGLGYETMRVLALRGAHVIGTGRTLEKPLRPVHR